MINARRLGLTFAIWFASLHLLWVLAVAFGWGQGLSDFLIGLHFVNSPNAIMEFDLMKAVGLLALASAVGYALGFFAGVIWNWINRN